MEKRTERERDIPNDDVTIEAFPVIVIIIKYLVLN